MREIKNNMEINKAQKIDLHTSKAEKAELHFGENAQEAKVKDFSNLTEVLGRSQVSKADNLKEDISFGLANPNAIENSDKFFDMAYAQLVKNNDPYAYEKASYMATLYAREFNQ